MYADFNYIICWWLTILVFGFLSLPVILKLFSRFYDFGYIFSKIFSISVISYLLLVLGIFKIIPFTNISIIFIATLSAIFNLFFIKKYFGFPKFFKIIFQKRKIFILEELFFLLILIIWSYVRSFQPDIEGLEKFMDWGFVNSILKTRFFPPSDMWYAGQSINYYYFGHLIFAVLTKVSNLPSTITYNLSIATTCALTFVSGFSLVSNFVYSLKKNIKWSKIISAGLISALLLTFGGNLHTVYKISRNYFETKNIQTAINSYWYPDATRFIGFDPDIKDKTIHEFPLYSFVVSDLHGHMNDIPIILFFLALLFSAGNSFFYTIIFGFVLSIAYMTNAWDFAVYGLVLAFYFLFKKPIFEVIKQGITVIIFWYIFTLPFSLNFVPMTQGLRLSDSHTPFYQLFVLYGGFWLIILPLIIFFIKNKFKNLKPADIFIFSLFVTATILVIIPEIGYIKDIYIYEHRRANTMFKLVYQAFIMYSLVAGFAVYRLSAVIKNKIIKIVYLLLFLIIFVSHLIYPYFAIKSYYNSFENYHGLWGLSYLKNSYPDYLAVIDWFNKNISNQPVIVEAVGDSYTTYNQISAATGLPTIEGWIVHEWLWRGGYDGPAARQTEVKEIYESKDIDKTKNLLHKYKVSFVIVGPKEHDKYEGLSVEKFNELGNVAYQSGEVTVYQITK